MKRERMEIDGEVVDSCKGKFNVKIGENQFVMAVLSGRIRQNEIKVLVGDKVIVEVSEYDTTQGRIVRRV